MGMLQAEHRGMRPAVGRAAGFMAASPFFPLVAPWPVGLGDSPKGRGVALDTGAAGAQGLGAEKDTGAGAGAGGGGW